MSETTITSKEAKRKALHKARNRKYIRTTKGRAAEERKKAKYRASVKGKATEKRYSQSANCKASLRKYQASAKGKIVAEKARKKYQNSPKGQARIVAASAVSNAIAAGKLPKPNTQKCKCGNPAKEYHHESYAPEHWLDVEAMCLDCHGAMRSSDNGK